MAGRMILRGGNLSSRCPMPGEQTAMVMAVIPKAMEIPSRFHPNASCNGARKRLKV